MKKPCVDGNRRFRIAFQVAIPSASASSLRMFLISHFMAGTQVYWDIGTVLDREGMEVGNHSSLTFPLADMALDAEVYF